MSQDKEVQYKKILSIQSNVVHGYVGNKAVTFPLQLFGWDVDILNTVEFSNHTGYGSFAGVKFTGKQLRQIFNGLVKNDLVNYDMIITGYIPTYECVREVIDIINDVKKNHFEFSQSKKSNKNYPEKLVYVLDPVMGDNSRLYVDKEVVDLYKILASSADIITPNQFEAELLTNCSTKINNMTNLRLVISNLHKIYKVKNIVVTSVKFDSNNPEVESDSHNLQLNNNEKDLTYFVAGSTLETPNGEPLFFIVPINFIPMYFSGTGDLFAAILAAKYWEYSFGKLSNTLPKTVPPLLKAVEYSAAVVQRVLETTLLYSKNENNHNMNDNKVNNNNTSDESESRSKIMANSELKIIQSASKILDPSIKNKAVILS